MLLKSLNFIGLLDCLWACFNELFIREAIPELFACPSSCISHCFESMTKGSNF